MKPGQLTYWVLGAMLAVNLLLLGTVLGSFNHRFDELTQTISQQQAIVQDARERVIRIETTYSQMLVRLANIEARLDKVLSHQRIEP